MPAIFVGSVLLVLIGGFGFTRAEQAAGDRPRPSNADKTRGPEHGGKLTLRAVSAETNEPIEGVSIEYHGPHRRWKVPRSDHHDRRRRYGGDRMARGRDGP